MENIELLQQQLKEQIEALSEQRRKETLKFEEEAAERNRLADLERKERLEAYEKRANELREVERKKNESLEAERREVERLRKASEQALNAQLVAKDLQEKQLKWLRDEIAKQEFIEEQHRKTLDNAKTKEQPTDESPTTINVEHPVAPDNHGEAVEGTTGATPDKPLMSDHLKHILRQATREY